MNREKVKTHKDLLVWQRAMDLVEEVYRVTERMPAAEQYGLTSQIRRSAVSIPSNVAEGAARNSTREFIQFLYIATGSAAELDTQFLLADRLGFLQEVPLDAIRDVKMMLVNLIKALKRKNS